MTEELNTTEQVEPEAPETEAPDTDDLDRWKTHSRLWQKRAQENLTRAEAGEAFASRVTELETQLEEATNKATTAEQALGEYTFNSLKSAIAREHGLSDDDAAVLLTSSSEEGLRAQAELIASKLQSASPEEASAPRVGFGVDGLQDREPGNVIDAKAQASAFFGF